MKCTAQTEEEMREYKVPYLASIEELTEFISSVVDRKHDYGTCCYAMSLAATATFNHIASKLGCTGFQASMADLDILRRTRLMDCPFMILKAEDMLYPQYDLHQKLQEAMDGWKDWAKEKAVQKLEQTPESHPEVKRRWTELAAN
jgi:hypothetical protein